LSASNLRLAGIGAFAGILTGIFIAIPVTGVAHALVLLYYQPAPIELAKSTCCGQELPSFQSQVLPNLTSEYLLGRTLLGLACGAAIGIGYVVIRRLVPGPSLIKATLFAIALALPFDIFIPANVGTPGVMALALTSPWESAFAFSGPLGTVPPYHMRLEFRVLLALPVVAAGLGIATLVAILDMRLPRSGEPRILESAYGFLTVIGGIGVLFLPLVTGLIQIGGD
jgi:hypothetical protein